MNESRSDALFRAILAEIYILQATSSHQTEISQAYDALKMIDFFVTRL
jgi:hypothetical protein